MKKDSKEIDKLYLKKLYEKINKNIKNTKIKNNIFFIINEMQPNKLIELDNKYILKNNKKIFSIEFIEKPERIIVRYNDEGIDYKIGRIISITYTNEKMNIVETYNIEKNNIINSRVKNNVYINEKLVNREEIIGTTYPNSSELLVYNAFISNNEVIGYKDNIKDNILMEKTYFKTPSSITLDFSPGKLDKFIDEYLFMYLENFECSKEEYESKRNTYNNDRLKNLVLKLIKK